MDGMASTGIEQILGTWKLLSYHLVDDAAPGSKPIAQPLGPTPLGRITFTSDGFMSATLTDPTHTKPLVNSAQWSKAPEEEVAFVARVMTTYCGWYKVFSENGELSLSTDVEIALNPSWIGTAQVRRVSLRKAAGKQIMILRPVQYLQLPVRHKWSGPLIGHANIYLL